MYTLSIDIGNTHTVFGAFDDEGRMDRSFRVRTDRQATADELYALLERSLARAGVGVGQVVRAVLGSVVPELNDEWRRALEGWSSLHSFSVLDAKAPWSFSIDLPDPWQVGADRLADAEGALMRARSSAVIVDAGTATTFDVLEARGQNFAYVGGVISPGVRIAMEALVGRAARLRSIALEDPRGGGIAVVGNSTESALRSGVIHGFASLVDGMVERIFAERKLAADTRVIGTGGLSILLKNYSRRVTEYAPDLTLEGQYALARRL